MDFPRYNSWHFNDVESYNEARRAAGRPMPAPTGSSRPSADADALAGQLEGLRVSRPDRGRAGEGSRGPRVRRSDIGGSTRLAASSAASLVDRDLRFQSARHELSHLAESPAASPEQYAQPRAARHGAYTSHTAHPDPAPRRKGGFMSSLKKGIKALGFGASRHKDSASRNARPSFAQHNIDASLRPSRVSSGRTSENLRRMDSAPQSPDRVSIPAPVADDDGHLEPTASGSYPIPTSPGSRREYEVLSHSFGSEYGAEHAPDPWVGPMGMPPAAPWHPLPPMGWQHDLDNWNVADAAHIPHDGAGVPPHTMDTGPSHAGLPAGMPLPPHMMGAGPSHAGPSAGMPLPQQMMMWNPPGYGMPPAGAAIGGLAQGYGIQAMEQVHRDLFTSPGIAAVDGREAVCPPVISTMDVDMDECRVINTAHGEYDSIGTPGVATCIAMCARGVNHDGETILGIVHHSGGDSQGNSVPQRAALERLRDQMHAAGARHLSVYVVGGMTSPLQDYDTLDDEWELLGLRNEFNIRGARLHVNSIEHEDEDSSVEVLMTANRVYFSRNSLY